MSPRPEIVCLAALIVCLGLSADRRSLCLSPLRHQLSRSPSLYLYLQLQSPLPCLLLSPLIYALFIVGQIPASLTFAISLHIRNIFFASRVSSANVQHHDMAHRPRSVPPAIDAKWAEMRRKHEEETDDFLRKVTKSRAELEDRADQARKHLLAKHLQAEQVFWSANGPGSRISMTPVPAARNGLVQTARRTQGTATPVPTKKSAPAKASTPVKAPVSVKKAASVKAAAHAKNRVPAWNPPAPAPALPRMEVRPIRETPSQTLAQESARSAKPPSWRVQKDGYNDVIVLSSDDEEDPVPGKTKPVAPKKTPVASTPVNMNKAQQPQTTVAPTRMSTAPKPMFTSTAQQPDTTQESMEDESASSDYSTNNFASTLPEATLEFFGGFSRAPVVSTLALCVILIMY